MFEDCVERMVARYQSELSVEGRRAFIAGCVRKGYTSRPEHKEIAVEFFEARDVGRAGMYIGSSARGVSVAAVCKSRSVRRPKSRGVLGHMLDCEREGLFSDAARVARGEGHDARAFVYERLDDFLRCGPFDEGHLFAAAEMLGNHPNAAYLRAQGELIREFKQKRDYDFA